MWGYIVAFGLGGVAGIIFMCILGMAADDIFRED
jgi:hypothetical protein